MFFLSAGMVGFMVWREKQPRDGFKVSLLPTLPFMFLGVLVCILAVVYLMHINGIDLPARGL